MREIKFRVWNKNRNMFIIDGMTPKEIQDDAIESMELPTLTSEDCVWQQYTGLKDKNGVEIYEGDLLVTKFFKPQENPTEVFWADAHSSWGVYAKNGQVGPLLNMHQEHHEVVGNIFEQLNLSDYQNENILSSPNLYPD
jgi:uncharacterized phage protein (TIGR01671 family)